MRAVSLRSEGTACLGLSCPSPGMRAVLQTLRTGGVGGSRMSLPQTPNTAWWGEGGAGLLGLSDQPGGRDRDMAARSQRTGRKWGWRADQTAGAPLRMLAHVLTRHALNPTWQGLKPCVLSPVRSLLRLTSGVANLRVCSGLFGL